MVADSLAKEAALTQRNMVANSISALSRRVIKWLFLDRTAIDNVRG